MSTHIEWTDETWNVATGCDRVSAGCDHCYALTMAKRLKGMGNPRYQEDGSPTTSGPGFGVTFHADLLALPSTWRKPRRVFVNSMGDLFHQDIADFEIARVFAAMARHPQHTFQVLTKRHARMRSLVSGDLYDLMARDLDEDAHHLRWPLPNVWLGVSAEDQKWETIRGDALRETPAAVRFYSAEPLLGAIKANLDGIDWVIVGGESGHGARPMHPDWARSLRDQCEAAGVAFLFKQWGESRPLQAGDRFPDKRLVSVNRNEYGWPSFLLRVGKKTAGRILDGRTWDEYPATVPA